MTPKKTIVGLSATAIIMGGIDASALVETPLDRTEMVANEIVQAKQVDNIVETNFPWKDQNGIKVKYDMGEPTLLEKFKDKRNKEVITETVDFGDGGFKVDILLNEKPDTNVFCYQIDGAENYDFFYQPPLTAEEIAEGASRPENIEGSYAVYHKTLKNHREGAENYATGKVMHIPHPQVWELYNEESTKEWADLSYSEKDGLCVTVRQAFLDNATYPVRVDPTFGYMSIGASDSATFSQNNFYGITGFPMENGVVNSISIYANDQSLGSFKGVLVNSIKEIVTDGVANATSVPVNFNWATSTYSTSPDVIAGAFYWIGLINNNVSGIILKQDSYTNGRLVDTSNSYASPTNPTDGSTSNVIHSIYATYTVPTPATTTYSCSGGICGGVNLSGGMNLR